MKPRLEAATGESRLLLLDEVIGILTATIRPLCANNPLRENSAPYPTDP